MVVQSIYDKHSKTTSANSGEKWKGRGKKSEKANMKNKEKSKWTVPRKFWSSSL